MAGMASEIRLRPLRRQDDGFGFLIDYVPGEPWETHLGRMRDQNRGLNLAADRVPATFLASHGCPMASWLRLPDGLDQAAVADGSVAGDQRQVQCECGGHDEPVPRVAQ